MKQRLVTLANRRARLLQEIAAQRTDVAEIFLDWQKPISLFGVGIQVVGFIQRNFGLLTGAIAGLVALRRKKSAYPVQE